MMNYKAIEKLLTGETEKESKVIRPEVFKDQTAYNTVMNNCQRIGAKDSAVFHWSFWKLMKITKEYIVLTWRKYTLWYANGTSINANQFWYLHIQKQQHSQ